MSTVERRLVIRLDYTVKPVCEIMQIESRNIVVGDGIEVSSGWAIPPGYDRSRALLIAHGAGNDMHSPLIDFILRSTAAQGILSVKFNFPYKERGGKAPDPPKRLIDTWRAVIAAVENDTRLSPKRMLMSGKSLGGRMASLLAAEGGRADGLVFFGYPLHPAGRQDKLRSAHFETISCPALFVQGTRDPLCNLDLLREEIIDKAPRLRALHIIDGGDHSFRVPKKLGRTEQSVFEEIAEATHRWIRARVPG